MAFNKYQAKEIALGQAVVLMVTFPWLYNQLASVAIWFTEGVQERFLLSTDGQWLHLLKNMLSGGTFAIILMLLFVVLIYILWFQMLKRGVELLILRLATTVQIPTSLSWESQAWARAQQNSV